MPELDGQIALVTGGGRGIGANIARELRSAGAGVAIAARTSDELEEIALEIDAYPVVTDVSKRESVESMVRAVESGRGPIDILCANAGVASSDERAWEADPADWWRTFEVNVLGVYLCCRAVIPGMLSRGRGRIIITGSGAAYLPGSSNSAYSASKAAVWRFGEVLARQLEGRIPRLHLLARPGAHADDVVGAGRRALDAVASGSASRARPRIGAGRRARRALPPRRARRHRGSDSPGGRHPRAGPERHSPAALARPVVLTVRRKP